MTTTTPDAIALESTPPRARRTKLRFGVAFLIGLVATLALGAGALYAFDQQYAGRILPGIRIGGVDLSGLEPASAADRLRSAYAYLGEGELVLVGPDGRTTVSYADIGRGPDVDAMVAEAMAIGRDGGPDRAGHRRRPDGHPRRGRRTRGSPSIPTPWPRPWARFAESLAIEPRDAAVVVTEDKSFEVSYARSGRAADLETPLDAALAAITALDAPERVEIDRAHP